MSSAASSSAMTGTCSSARACAKRSGSSCAPSSGSSSRSGARAVDSMTFSRPSGGQEPPGAPPPGARASPGARSCRRRPGEPVSAPGPPCSVNRPPGCSAPETTGRIRSRRRRHRRREPVKTRAAMLWDTGRDWEIAELDLDEPKQGEVLIRWVAAGLCHSDEHLRHGDIVPRFPIVGGHEGAGIIEKVGPGRLARQGGRPRRHLLPARLRPLPLLRHRALEHLRPRGDDPRRLHARRHVPLPRRRPGRRRDVHARLLQPVQRDLRDQLRQRRQGPAAGDRRARRLRRPDRLVQRGLRRRRGAGRDRDHLRHRRHRLQRRPGRQPRRRGQHHRRRPAGQQARDGRRPRAPPTASPAPPRPTSSPRS